MTLSSRDPVAVTKAARRLVQAGEWRTLPGRDDKAKILMALKARLPFALTTGAHIDALVALGKELGPGQCHWCAAAVVRELGKPELARDDVNRAALGNPCADCEARWEQAAVAAREAAHIGQLVAAGFRPRPPLTSAPPNRSATTHAGSGRWRPPSCHHGRPGGWLVPRRPAHPGGVGPLTRRTSSGGPGQRSTPDDA